MEKPPSSCGGRNSGAMGLSRRVPMSSCWPRSCMPHSLHSEKIPPCSSLMKTCEENSHCLIFLSKKKAHKWPNLHLYAFPQVALLPQFHQGGQRSGRTNISSPLANSTEEGPPFLGKRDDLAPPTQVVEPPSMAPLQEPAHLSQDVLNTFAEVRVPSIRHLYALKWSHFRLVCTLSLVTSQSCPSYKNCWMRAHPIHSQGVCGGYCGISHPCYSQLVGRNDLAVKFLMGARRLNLPRPHTVPTWDLSTVLRALRSSCFRQLSESLSCKCSL